MRAVYVLLVAFCLLALSLPARAVDAEVVRELAFGESDEQVAAVAALVAKGDAQAAALLQALADGELQTAGKQVLIVKGDAGIDAATGQKIDPLPAEREDVSANNRLRRELATALAALKLLSPDRAVRFAAAKELSGGAGDAMLPLLKKALAKETDSEIKSMLETIQAALELKSPDHATRVNAIRILGLSNNSNAKTLLLSVLEKTHDGKYIETDEEIYVEAQKSLRAVEGGLAWGDRIGVLFSGVSLGSILLLAALGLAITYGLMGVINMAHGELIMIGAYTTYVIQNLFKSHAPGLFDWYLACAVPGAFLAAALVGIILERTVIRFLYGRPLETLLATWGISLFLIQLVRTIFGPQNVEVSNPSWMSGGVEFANLTLPYSRIVIIAFAIGVMLVPWLMLSRTRLGLFIRGVTQNRAMASCVGVNTRRVDMVAFAFGS